MNIKCDVFLLFTAGILIVCIVGEDFVCEQDVSYIENECNDCFCTEKGKLGCTLKACFDPAHTSKNLRKCVIGTTYEKGCNKCWCVGGMGTICTNNDCFD